MLEKIFPKVADNEYKGSKVPLYVLIVITCVFTFRSLVHFLAPDSGVQMIASIMLFEGYPDPNRIIYMFSSLGGAMQLLMVIIYVIVMIRYRNLIPLVYVLLFIETVFRIIVGMIHPLTAEYFTTRPPGTFLDLPMLFISVIMLYLSIGHKSKLN